LAVVLATVVGVVALFVAPALSDNPLSGAIFTTNSDCSGVDLNIYSNKIDVYVDGGPAHPGAASLPDGSYYVQVTDPSGATVLGTSVGTGDQTPFVVSGGGTIIDCDQLWSILIKGSDQSQGYDDTPNSGGEYKLWVSNESSFTNSSTKTDNFKVRNAGDCEPNCGPPPQSTLNVVKFYDANANGLNDDGPTQAIAGWRVRIQDGMDLIRYTPVSVVVDPDTYTVTESDPIQTNWSHTTPNPVVITVADGGTGNVEFGNVCVGAGGGLTIGFWSNNNGFAKMNDADTLLGPNSVNGELSLLSGLNLIKNVVTAKKITGGTAFDPGTYATFKSWLLSAEATNMAYMLSAQLAGMALNVEGGLVNASALIYAPGTTSANSLGFATVGAVMTEANASLLANPWTVASSAARSSQERLKIALDKANNNLNFVQSTPCAFSFAS
jgi:hypothetical protein